MKPWQPHAPATTGTVEIRYVDANGKRSSLYPGKINKRDAETLCRRIEHIVSRQITGSDPEPAVSQWLADIAQRSQKLYAKLVKAGLASPIQADEPEPVAEPEADPIPTIKEWTDRYIKEHPGKDGTIEQLEITARSLCKKFGDDKRIDTFTAGDAESYRKWLQTKGNERKKYKTGLATGTVRRRIGRSKQFFNAAIKHELIDKNPFAGEASATTGNPDRLVMVPADWIEACIRKAPCEDWRIILALARYGDGEHDPENQPAEQRGGGEADRGQHAVEQELVEQIFLEPGDIETCLVHSASSLWPEEPLPVGWAGADPSPLAEGGPAPCAGSGEESLDFNRADDGPSPIRFSEATDGQTATGIPLTRFGLRPHHPLPRGSREGARKGRGKGARHDGYSARPFRHAFRPAPSRGSPSRPGRG